MDGIHGGEVVYAKALLSAAEKNPALRPFLRTDFLRKWTAANAGNTSPATIAFYGEGAPEIDFLQMGCKKFSPQMLDLRRAD